MALLSGWSSADMQEEITEFITRSNNRFTGSFWVKSEWTECWEDILNKNIISGDEMSDLNNRCSARSANISHSNVSANSATISATIYGHDDDAFGTLQYRVAYDTDSNFGSPSYSSTGSLSTYSITGGNSVNRTISGLSGSTTYYYRMEVKNPWQDVWNTGQRGQIASGSLTTPACADPTDFTAVADGLGSVALDWNYGSNPNGFEIQYSVDGGSWNVETSLGGSARSYNHSACNESNIDSNTKFVTYRIRANCSGADSSWVISDSVDPQCK